MAGFGAQGPSPRQPCPCGGASYGTCCRQLRWGGLEIVAIEAVGATDLEGTVTFAAHYSARGQPGVLRERSRFGREGGRADGAWLYLEALEPGA